MKILLICCSLFLFTGNIWGQTSRMILSNTTIYPEDRYKEYKGSPFYFKDWVKGDIYNQNGDVFENMTINYNIFESLFEILEGKKYAIMDPYFYWCVKVDKEDNPEMMKDMQDSILFIRGLMANDEKKFVQVMYNGTHIKLLKDMNVAESVKSFQNVGQTVTNKRFNRKDKYYIVIDGEYNEVKLNKKDILKALGPKKELEQWAKEQKNKLKKDADFESLLAYYEATFLIK